MKLTDLERTATTCWGPVQYQKEHSLCPLVATGTVAGAFDASFSATSNLEIFALNLADASSSNALLELGKLSSSSRFNKLAWSSAGVGQDKPYGIIAGGKEDGSLDLYNPAAIFEKKEASLLHKQAHNGQLAALDFNPFQPNLLATGASKAEISIWDLNNPEKPYSPGAKSPRLEDITCLAWNRQVQHILASSSSNGYSVIWDLKNRREIIHLTSPTRKRVTAIAWNPEVATQLLTASDDDNVPAIYMWDLRNAHAPEKVLNGHSKGVLSLSWSQKDSELLLSCGKDNRTLCWNPNSAEVIGEFPTSSNWVFDVQWCPKNPDLLSFASFDGNVSFYTIQAKSSSDSTDSSATPVKSDPFAPQPVTTFTLKQPPKWLRCPVGASFGFGNKLVTFTSSKTGDASPVNRVSIKEVVTNVDLVQASSKLETTLETKDVSAVCQKKIDTSEDAHDASVWQFMNYINDDDARRKIVQYLGFDREELSAKFAGLSTKTQVSSVKSSPKREPLKVESDDPFSAPANAETGAEPVPDLFTNGSASTEFDQYANVGLDNKSVPSITSPKSKPFKIFQDGIKSGLDADITRCVIAGDFASAVELCLDANRLDDALMLAIHGGDELLERTQKAFYDKKRNRNSYLRVSSCLAENDLRDIVYSADIVDSWREVLALVCTFASTDEFSPLATELADKLREECDIVKDTSKKADLRNAAVLSYMVAGRIDKLVGIWIDQYQTQIEPLKKKLSSIKVDYIWSTEFANVLQSLIEKISIYRQLVPEEPRDDPVYAAQMKALGKEYLMYSWLLLSQGQAPVALKYLNVANHKGSAENPTSPISHGLQDIIGSIQYRVYKSLSSTDIVAFTDVPALTLTVTNVVGEIPDHVDKTAAVKKSSPEKKPLVPNYAPTSTYPYPTQNSQPSVPSYTTPAAQPSVPAYPNPSYSTPQPPAQSYGASQPNPYGTPSYGAQQQQWNNQYGGYGAQNTTPGYGAQNTTPGYGNQYYGQTAPPQQTKPLIPQPPPMVNSAPSNAPLSPPAGATGAGAVKPAESWNDPPQDLMKSKPKRATAPPPIASPFGTAQPGMNASGAPAFNQAPPQQGYTQPQYRPSMPSSTPQSQPGMYQQPGYGQPPVSNEPRPKSPVGHPVGDRSHIPDDHKPIFESLSRLLNNCKPNAGPPQRKVLDDVEKRLNVLFDKLNNELVGDEAIQFLLQLSKTVESRDWNGSSGLQQQIMTACGSKEGTNWILGLKRLLDLAKTLV